MTALWIIYCAGAGIGIALVLLILSSDRGNFCGLGLLFLAMALLWPLVTLAAAGGALIDGVANEVARRHRSRRR